jgi:L-iditol 2-dehydrogenase
MDLEPVPKTMRALVYRGVNDLRLETVPVPRIGPDELLVKVAACGICPTDIKKIQNGTVPPPRVFGHETAGMIARVGPRVRGFKVGERVALHHHIPCLDCHACHHRAFAQCLQYKKTGITAGFEPAGGGFAEYVRVMRFVLPGVMKIPRRNTFEEGAMLEPVNTVLKATRRLPLLRRDWVLVVGQGPIGLLFTALLKLEGCRVLATDLFESKLAFARKLGADKVFLGANPSDALSLLPRNNALDAAIVTVPSDEAVEAAHQSVRGGGAVMIFGHTRRGAALPVDAASICVDEKDLLGSYSADVTLQKEVADLVFSRRLDVRPFITHRFSLDNATLGIALATRPTAASLKIVIQPEFIG